MNADYKASGVDVEAGYRSVELIKEHVRGTLRKEVLSGLGGFGGMFSITAAKGMEEPVLVSGTDGVGTKLKIAFLQDVHDTVGIDCVAMCVNDIVCSGAEPLFFLDYIACGKNSPERIAQIVKGVSDGCKMAGASLIGGETAEMPGFYKESEYDLAGFAVGLVDKRNMIDGSTIKEGDAIIGLASNGVHSNGFSLIRKVLRPNENNLAEFIQNFDSTLGEELMRPTRIYVRTISELMKTVRIKGIANITGGGFIENIPRMLPEGLEAKIERGTWEVLPVFDFLQRAGDISERSMYNIFNMGIGMVLTVDKDDEKKTRQILTKLGVQSFTIGEIIRGSGIEIC